MERKYSIFALASALTILAGCSDDRFDYLGGKDNKGELEIGGLVTDITTKADEADGTYMLYVRDDNNSTVWSSSYSAIKEGTKISLLAGHYTLEARSTSSEVPDAKFSAPVYGVSEEFDIQAAQTTSLGTLTCTLLQSAVSVGYNDDFLAMVTGDGVASVEVTSGSTLDYALSYNNGSPKYDRRIGYFAVNGGENTTMTVTFKGGIEGKTQKMTTTITGIKPRDYHIVTFMKKVNQNGDVTIGIEIDGLVADVDLNNDFEGDEQGDGNDPNAPVGDGGISLVSTCSYDITQPIVVPTASESFNLTMQAQVPNGTLKFTVDIASTNADFINSVNTVGGTTLDLINPSEAAMGIFDIVPFPHGSQLKGATSIDFDLSNAQTPLLGFKGTHTFKMNVTDQKGCRKSIDIVLVVE